jgi:hypothetical protein
MTTLLSGTLERTVGWFHPRDHAEPDVQFRRTVSPFESAHGESHSGAVHTDAHAPAQRAVPMELRLRQWLCAASRGHAFIMGIDGPRMYLICQHCFHETAGWELGGRPPRVRD